MFWKSIVFTVCEHEYMKIDPPPPPINPFINNNAILNRDALWCIQGKKHYLQAAIVGGIHHSYNTDMPLPIFSMFH